MSQMADDFLEVEGYRINFSRCLGRGSYGDVSLAKHMRTGEWVAAKRNDTSGRMVVASAIAEIKSLQKLKHPHILKMIDFSFQKKKDGNGYVWLFIELCNMGNLNQYYCTHNPDINESIMIMYQCADALKYLHNPPHCIVHRDLKPQNILMNSFEEQTVAKIADFGLLRVVETPDIAQTYIFNTKCGTPGYMAPEIFLKRDPDAPYGSPVDVFSLGLVYAAMLRHEKGSKDLLSPAKVTDSLNDSCYGSKLAMYKQYNLPHPRLMEKKETDSREIRILKQTIQRMTTFEPKDRASMAEIEEILFSLGGRSPYTGGTDGVEGKRTAGAGCRPKDEEKMAITSRKNEKKESPEKNTTERRRPLPTESSWPSGEQSEKLATGEEIYNRMRHSRAIPERPAPLEMASSGPEKSDMFPPVAVSLAGQIREYHGDNAHIAGPISDDDGTSETPPQIRNVVINNLRASEPIRNETEDNTLTNALNRVCLEESFSHPSDHHANDFEIGEKVRIEHDEFRATLLQRGHGEWVSSMEKYLGQYGIVQKIVLYTVRVQHDDGIKISYNPKLLYKTGEKPFSESQLKGFHDADLSLVQDIFQRGNAVRLHYSEEVVKCYQNKQKGGWKPSMAKCLGMPGIVNRVDGVSDVYVEFINGEKFYINPELLTPVEDTEKYEAGDMVLIHHHNKRLAKKIAPHLEGWTENMIDAFDKLAIVKATTSDRQVTVEMFDTKQSFTWHPRFLKLVAKRDEVLDLL